MGGGLHPKKHLQFNALRQSLSEHFWAMDDKRQNGKTEHQLHDCLMAAFAMMFFQDPSLLAFQKRLEEKSQLNNLKTIFQVDSIPKDSQLRNTLDQVDTQRLLAIFSDWLQRLQRGKHLADYTFLDRFYLVPVDGSQYFSSTHIHCPSCLRATSKARTRYYHQILQAVIVHPDMRQVMPLAPEAIQNTDGSKKQDCEINAGKRLVANIRKRHPKLPIIITGDGLYSKQPFIDVVKQARMSYILVARPDDHKILFEWVRELQGLGAGGSLEFTDDKGRKHRYQWVNNVPLNGAKDADEVHFFEYDLIVNDKVTYRNSWVSDIAVDQSNVLELVKGGRARWKIENETFNTLKNQGYHIEHNFGHGKRNLAMNFFVLNLLAFYMHQIFELTDRLYQSCRAKSSSRKEYFSLLRHMFQMLLFRNWQHMLNFIHAPPDCYAPQPSG
jgi:hypothetical protein